MKREDVELAAKIGEQLELLESERDRLEMDSHKIKGVNVYPLDGHGSPHEIPLHPDDVAQVRNILIARRKSQIAALESELARL
jgi:hypothetical protein